MFHISTVINRLASAMSNLVVSTPPTPVEPLVPAMARLEITSPVTTGAPAASTPPGQPPVSLPPSFLRQKRALEEDMDDWVEGNLTRKFLKPSPVGKQKAAAFLEQQKLQIRVAGYNLYPACNAGASLPDAIMEDADEPSLVQGPSVDEMDWEYDSQMDIDVAEDCDVIMVDEVADDCDRMMIDEEWAGQTEPEDWVMEDITSSWFPGEIPSTTLGHSTYSMPVNDSTPETDLEAEELQDSYPVARRMTAADCPKIAYLCVKLPCDEEEVDDEREACLSKQKELSKGNCKHLVKDQS
ncbi:hypothetical protein DFH27DRAFT_524301 [Peziza echinospora]|nr:hypothetical protein DFH27DRAFT_524301 [Peziza echinospora]